MNLPLVVVVVVVARALKDDARAHDSGYFRLERA